MKLPLLLLIGTASISSALCGAEIDPSQKATYIKFNIAKSDEVADRVITVLRKHKIDAKVFSDTRTNRIMLLAPSDELEQLKRFIEQFDIVEEPKSSSPQKQKPVEDELIYPTNPPRAVE